MTVPTRHRLPTVDLGRVGYPDAMIVQRDTHHRVLRGTTSPTLLLVEHDPVITVSRRRGAATNLRATPHQLEQLGIAVLETDRGGDITYHGPGQLVAYPILSLAWLRFNLGHYMRWLEQVVIDTVETFGVRAYRVPKLIGIWVDAPPQSRGSPAGRPAKLCAFGVRVQRQVTMHGLALNVSTDLSHFQTIVPCGLIDRPVTSLQQLLGPATPTMAEVKGELSRQFERSYSMRLTDIQNEQDMLVNEPVEPMRRAEA